MGDGDAGRGTGAVGREPATRRRSRRSAAAALAFAAILGVLVAIGATASAQGPLATVLVFHDGSDPVTDAGIGAITELGADNDFEVVASADPAEFTAANLESYPAVIFLGVEGSPLSGSQLSALQGYIQDGNGFLGIGTTATAQPASGFFEGLVGARPDPASSDAVSDQTVAAGDRVHPSTRGLPLELTRSDVWYQWEGRPTGQVHTVARYHAPDAPAGDGTNVGGTDWPISWCRDFQGGRSFYTGMGRTADSYSEAAFRDHLLGAIQWSTGLVRANCKATIASNYEGERLVNGASGDLSHTGESHGLTVAPNGWVIYIGRGDCRTNAQRGEIAGLPGPTPRILDFADPNVGIGCGTVHIFDPDQDDGTVNSGVTLAGIVPVYGDRGGGSPVNGMIESGLVGVTVAPDFMETGHIYLQYFPTLNPDNPNHPGLEDGDDVRRTKMTRGRISRFTIDLETKELEFDSEVVIFEYDAQIWSCCHVGGGTGFDSEGNLYITTGDTNASQGSSGYSGNNPTAKCPARDPGEPDQESANNLDCGELTFSYQDARRTAGSTNDYNGKMLRFNPIDDIPDGEQPPIGEGTTYTLPDADSPNGPNLFTGDEGGGDLTRPEIYAMGFRNPSRLSIDPETDVPYAAWVGPDAGGPNVELGPSTYESASQIAQAGNYGWPYCMGNQQGYRDLLSGGTPRSTNPPGFVFGGPAGSPIPGFYDCEDLVNDSENNTGLEVLPHETGTGMDAGTASPVNIWYSRGNLNSANGCPDFPRPNTAPDYGAVPTPLCPYATSSGATIMNGPLYRYPDTADPSVAWPEYWDGRWFVWDWNNNSIRHGLLLDPETDQDGGQPVYADSLRGVLNWTGNLMDTKFAPDGSLYMQVYDGFFSTGNNAGLWRFTYTGGADTPGADPQWRATGTPLDVAFDVGASGGVAYEWDFGDGETSTEASPTHAYAEDGPYEVTLTVTYADDQTDSQTITINVQSGDTVPPETTIELNGADPVATYDGPVEVALEATDDGSGVELTQFRVDEDAFTAYEEPFTVFGEGEHTVFYRSRDAAGNVEETKSVTFAIEALGGCDPLSDQFDEAVLDPKWELINPNPASQPSVGGGHLTMPIVPGDFIGPIGTAQTLQQPVPDDESWVATAKIAHAPLDAHGEMAGLVLINSIAPNHFVKTGPDYRDDTVEEEPGNQPGIWVERFLSAADGFITIEPETQPFPNTELYEPAGDYVWTRFAFDATTRELSTWVSDDGITFTDWALEIPVDEYLNQPGGWRIGIFAKHDGTGDDEVDIDAFNFVRGTADPQTPGDDCGEGGGGGTCDPLSDQFDQAMLDPKWELINPHATSRPSVGGGHLTMPIVPGDFIGPLATGQALLQPAPDDEPWVATAKVAHESFDVQGEMGGLVLINSIEPNHFVKTGPDYRDDADPDPGDQPGIWIERFLSAAGEFVTLPGELVPFPNTGLYEPAGDYVWTRFAYDHAARELSTWVSDDGITFTDWALEIPVDEYLSEPGGWLLGIMAKHDGTGDDEAQIDYFNFVRGTADPQTPGDDCGEGGDGDTTPPTTTATLDPPEPDGESGWYVSPVAVTLDATDNEGGSGVDSTVYRVGGGAFQDYTDPFTVSDDGEHTVEFRSIDAEGNFEPIKSVELRIDSTPPATEAIVSGNEIRLRADDGPAGSGVAQTEFRVDGGAFQTYVEEETILDSESDLALWAHAGPGGFDWVDEGDVTDTVTAVTASGENPPGEVKENLVDGSAETKWLVFEGTGWVEFELSEPVALTRYALTSANDAPGRDPMDWIVSGSDDGETWTEVDRRSGQDFAERLQTNLYDFENETAYRHYRLEITANHGEGLLQLAEVALSDGSGFARTEGGLGLLWYAERQFSDFALSLQWRRQDETDNSGVFVRFPDGGANTHNTAISQGYEVQIREGVQGDGENQKTGSIYNFDREDARNANPPGEWNDYEIRVTGFPPRFEVTLNGELVNDFQATSTSQGLAPGYIGLQNHGPPDLIDFRNVRVLPIADGAVEGPIVLEPGRHLVEFRSTDGAGNVEAIKSVGEPPSLDGRVTPRRKKVKPGKKARFAFSVTNRGDGPANNVQLCVKAPKKQVKVVGRACRNAGSLAAGRSTRASFTARPKRNAAGRQIRLRFIATASNASRETATATLKVKRARRR